MKMTEAEATVRHAIRNAMASTSELTGLRAGPVVDRLVDAILVSLLKPAAAATRAVVSAAGP
jgi:hypothetical protein